MPDVLYTYGYAGGGSLEDLQAYARADALILDVRYSPWSWGPQWRRAALEGTLGTGYLWLRTLGNANYNTSGPIRLADPAAGLAALRVLLEVRPVVLLCGCADVSTCHRRLVAEMAVEELPGLVVVHLRPGDRLPEGEGETGP